jgi:alcohol dehydrogenase
MREDTSGLGGRELALEVARAMLELSRAVGMPTSLGEVEGFTDAHVARALEAAKDPKLAMKLLNMPVPLSAADVDESMGSVLEAARAGDPALVRTAG